MHSRRSPLVARSPRSSKTLRRFLLRGWWRRALCLALIFGLLMVPDMGYAVRAASTLAAQVAKDSVVPVPLAVEWFKRLFRRSAKPPRQETLADRLAFVAQLQVTPRRFVGYLGQAVTFTALPLNADGQTIQGVRFDWESSDNDKVGIDDAGHARLLQPGLVRITCRAGNVRATVPLLVRPGTRLRQSDADWQTDQQSLKETSATGADESRMVEQLAAALLNHLTPTAQAQAGWTDDLGYDELWNDPRNLVGSPRQRAVESTRIGTVLPEGSNFKFAAPIIGLGGRGLGTSLTLYYNSRLWSRRNNSMAYNAIVGWPAPGFSLGFGRIITYDISAGGNPTCKYMLIDPDGTRHYLGSGLWAGFGYALGGPFECNDGSHLIYTGNGRDGGDLHYPDGTTVHFTMVNNRLLPTSISDRNGNYVQIAYKPECVQVGTETYCQVYAPMAIDYITDTLGRVIQFNYDTNYRLTSITVPGFGGTAQNPITQTVVQFDYQTVTTNGTFSGLTLERGSGSSITTLKHIYFPATGTGYMPSYTIYGMIKSMSGRRQMSIGWPNVIQDGVESNNVSFNYPTAGPLTDAPAFTQRTETAVNATTATYTYTSSTNSIAQTKTYTITQPDNSTLNLTRSTNSASVANGRLVQAELKSGSTSLAQTVFNYANDAGGSPQVQSVTSYDDTGTPVKVDFDYDLYGNILNKREYGYQVSGQWQVRRRTRYVYKTDTAYVNAYLRNLVIETDLYDAQLNTNDADDVLVAKTTYAYDNYAAMGGMEDYGGGAAPPGHMIGYTTSVTVRGNVTGVSEWTDLQAGTVITHLAKIDIFGNAVKAQVSCCQEKDLTNTEATYWSQPSDEMSGDPNGVHQTTSTDYDFNTSLSKSHTDAGGLTTQYSYDAFMRQTGTTLPTGQGLSANYDYGSLSSSSTVTYYENEVMKTLTTTVQYDGWWRAIQNVDAANAQVNTAYDAMGRVISRTNPFAAGGTPGPATTYQYDLLGRLKVTTLPDGSTLQNDYVGGTMTMTDQVNRKMKRESDGLGRSIKVTEQDATGALAQETTYTYNLLDKLTLVNQGNQTRSYKYDALGRLLFERTPERSATINDGSGTFWSAKLTYTEFDALNTRQDARGVVTTYSYDALHRTTGISYNTSGAAGVAETPSVSLSYNVDGSLSQASISATSTTPNSYTETNSYDSFGRAQSVTRWILGQAYDTRKTYTTSYEYNDASQLMKMVYPSGQQVAFNHDDKGRLQSMTYNPGDSSGYVTGITYNSAGQVGSLTLGNGVSETYAYDSQRMHMTGQTATKGATTLMSLTYGYQASAGQMGAGSTAGNSGQLVSISGTINGATEAASYYYDNSGRLKTSSQTSNGQSANRTYSYDRWGNRTAVYNDTQGINQIQSVSLQQSGGIPTNRITSVTNSGTTVNYTYDANGNVTNDGVHTYVYDAENRVVSVDSGTVQYRYDHQNRRVCKIAGASWTHYIWEGSQVIAEHDATTAYTSNPTYQVNSARADYIYSRNRLIWNRQRASSGSAWTSRYYLSDRLSTRLVLDTSGNVVGRQAHLPFGEDFAETGTQEKHHFTNYERDGETGQDYAVNRHMQPAMGRFLQVDKADGEPGNPQSWNAFTYNRNEPINTTDPTGLFFVCWHSIIFGFTFLLDGVEVPDFFFGIPAEFCIAIFFAIIHPRPERSCNFDVRLKGDPIIGGYPEKERGGLKGFDPNKTPHGFHDNGDGNLVDRLVQFYYYFEVQAVITGGIGNRADWKFNQRLVIGGSITIDLGNGQVKEIPVDPKDKKNIHDPDNPIKDNFIWDDNGYHYLDTPSVFKLADFQGGFYPIVKANLTFTFTLTGHHETNGRTDITCPTKTFTLTYTVDGNKRDWK